MHNRRLDGRPGKGFFKQPTGRLQDINILVWLYRDKMDKKRAPNYLTRYRDLDWLYKNKRGKNTAEDYLIRAYILYKSIGEEKEAKEVLSDIRELKKER
jgi:hypothetical protein